MSTCRYFIVCKLYFKSIEFAHVDTTHIDILFYKNKDNKVFDKPESKQVSNNVLR